MRKKTLTKNEKILLILLSIILIFWAVFRFIIIPQTSKLQNLIDQRYEYEDKISQMNTILKNEKNIDEEWTKLHREEDIIFNKYFPNLDQPQIIYLLNEVLTSEELDVLDISFNTPSQEQIGDLMVSTLDINIPYRGNYNGLTEVIERIVSGSKKILISALTMDKDQNSLLAGNISLKIYSLEGIAETDENLVYIEKVPYNNKANPFKPFDDYVEKSDEDNIDNIEEDLVLNNNMSNSFPSESSETSNYQKDTLEEFDNGGLYFIPSNKNIKGSLSKSTNSKHKKHSLRFEYNILALEDENRAYVDLLDRNIILKYPPSYIGIWVYSYGYSPSTLGLRFKGQAGEKIDLELTKGIGWTGWKYVEVVPPQDLSLYSLQLDRIYLETGKDKDDYGVLLFDKLEASYPKDGDLSNQYYTFYIVEKGDTLDKISLKVYGTTKKKNIIVKHNELISDKDIREGKILVMPK